MSLCPRRFVNACLQMDTTLIPRNCHVLRTLAFGRDLREDCQDQWKTSDRQLWISNLIEPSRVLLTSFLAPVSAKSTLSIFAPKSTAKRARSSSGKHSRMDLPGDGVSRVSTSHSPTHSSEIPRTSVGLASTSGSRNSGSPTCPLPLVELPPTRTLQLVELHSLQPACHSLPSHLQLSHPRFRCRLEIIQCA